MSLRRILTPRALVCAVLSTIVGGLGLLAGCGADPAPEGDPVPPWLTRPASSTTILVETTAADLAIAVSRQLYGHAPVVLLASADDLPSQRAAATRAAQLGGPLLLLSPESTTALAQELTRLAPAAVVPLDDAAAAWAETDSDTPVVTDDADLPAVAPVDPLSSVLVLVDRADADDLALAAVTTARTSGAQVLPLVADDPRADPAAIAALAEAEQRYEDVLALGERFGPPDQLRDRLAVAAAGHELPGRGQLVFPGRRMVAIYGHPDTPVLGVLGEQPLPEAIDRAVRTAEAYQELVDEPVVPVLEIITTIASSTAGPNKDYSRPTPVADLRPWVEAAAEAGVYVVLDLQPGRTDFLTQAMWYEELLTEPHVGLALDPEWRLAPDQRHLVQIGSVDADEVNEVADWLATLTRQHRLPQKLLVLHQFRLSMIKDRDALHTGHDELALLLHADGHGNPEQKLHTWRTLLADAPAGVWWGWKNFYDEDQPTFTPGETVALQPSPMFISYQ